MDKASRTKIKLRQFISVAIFIFIVGLIVFMAGRVVVNAVHGETNLDLVAFARQQCRALPMSVSDHMVVIRVDDIQAYAWTDISRRIIQDTNTKGIVPVVGIIPKDFKQDEQFYNFIRSVRCNVEVALHGWDHTEREFADISKDEARERIDKGRKILEILSRSKIYTFIPPEDLLSVDATKAVHEGKFIVSAGESGSLLDFTTTTYDYRNKAAISPQAIAESCDIAYRKTHLCIVMVHPQDFATPDGKLDAEKYQNYLTMLDTLKNQGATFVTFKYLFQHKWKSPQGQAITY